MGQQLLKGHLDLILLSIIEPEPTYGLRIIQEAQIRTSGYFDFKEGSLYPALHRLVEQGFLKTEMHPSSTGGAPRKYYCITETGTRELHKKREEWKTFSQAVNTLGGIP